MAKGEKISSSQLAKPNTESADYIRQLTALSGRLGARGTKMHLKLLNPAGPGHFQPVIQLPAPPLLETNPFYGPVDWPAFTNFFSEIKPEIVALAKFATRPPRITNLGQAMPGEIFDISRWLSTAALNEAYLGNQTEALDFLESLRNYSDLGCDDEWMLVATHRQAAIHILLSTTLEVIQVNGWTDPQLRRLQVLLEDLDPLLVVQRGATGELAAWTDMGEQLRAARVPRSRFGIELRLARATGQVDKEASVCLQHNYRFAEVARALYQRQPWTQVAPLVRSAEAEIAELRRSKWLGTGVCVDFLPNSGGFVRQGIRNEAVRRLLQVELALRRYRLAYGEYPAELLELVPHFLTSEPRDPIDGQSLRYRRIAERDFLLYSVGEDEVDDGGDPAKDHSLPKARP